MQCPNCHFENPEGMKFCGQCGQPLKNRCPNCGFENPPQFKFCGECGASLTGQTPAPKPTRTDKREEKDMQAVSPAADRGAPEAERRQITVMFCDLVGSTPLSEQLDPEELRQVLHDYQSTCAKVIRRFEGHIARYFGDGLMVYFGYPHAHEDDAHRAVRAGLGIVEGIGGLNTRLQQTRSGDFSRSGAQQTTEVVTTTPIRLQVRLGIHTGLVVAGDMDTGEQLESMAIIGETPNIAARLQGLAEPDTLVVSTATYRLIQGFFDCRHLGAHSLKGISQPMEVYRVLHESAAKSRLDVAAMRGLTPLVGRELEVARLLECWERIQEGEGQVALISGEAGIGKSRVVSALKEHVSLDPGAWLTECRCSPYYQNSAFYPVIELFERVILQFEREDSQKEKLSKLEGWLVQYGFSLEEAVPLFAALLSLPLSEGYAPLNLTPERQKQKTLQALLKALLLRTSQQPVLLVVEDLHWVDPSTLELLTLIIDQVPTARLLALFTFRPDFSPPWGLRSHLTSVTLTRLSPKQVEGMVERVTGEKALPAEVLKQIVAKTDGVPLFVEELTKMVLESGLLRERDGRYELTGPLPPLAIPATLADSLTARLDRLATVKEVAQLGAVIGREFSYELLSAVSPLDEATLQRELARLVDAEILYPRGLPPQGSYLFKHALIQDAAYQSLLKSRRGQFHTRIAHALEKQFPETVETQPELVAHHYTEAGLIAQAIPYWQKAGQRAIKRSANLEAIGHLRKGLELLKTQPDGPERIQLELALQAALGVPLMAMKGFTAPEVFAAYTRARELCQLVGETPQLFPVLYGVWAFYFIRAELQAARELGEQFVHLTQRQQDSDHLLAAHRVLGAALLCLGELSAARIHFEEVITCYDINKHRSHAFLYGRDPGVDALGQSAWLLWMQGYPNQGKQRSDECLTLAQALDHSHTLAIALTIFPLIHQLRQEEQLTQERAEAAITFSTEQGTPFWRAFGTILHGWALSRRGQGEEGIVQIEKGLAAYRAIGAELLQPYFLGLLAEAYGRVGQAEKGLAALDEALARVEKTGERWWEAELYRLKGELLLMQQRSPIPACGEGLGVGASAEPEADKGSVGASPPQTVEPEAETCFHKALDVTRHQQAKSWELRTAVSLGRLWQRQGKKEEARKMLAEIYGWFTEGFDTADLKEAKALLEELS